MSAPTAHVPDVPEIVIRPPGRFSTARISELWAHRELIYFLTKRELQVRYNQSFFGVSWVILQPLLLAFVFALLFGKVTKLPVEGFPPAVFFVAGLVPWLFCSTAILNTAGSLVQDANLISKVYFPRLAIPISKAASLCLDLVFSVPIVLLIALLYGVGIQWTVVLVPLFLGLGVLTAFALGTWLAALNVKYRDVAQVVPVLVQILFFVTPVLYSDTGISGGWRYVYALNPMSSVIDGFRWAVIGTHYPGGGPILFSAGVALAMLVGALYYFRRTELFFADIV